MMNGKLVDDAFVGLNRRGEITLFPGKTKSILHVTQWRTFDIREPAGKTLAEVINADGKQTAGEAVAQGA